MLRRLALLSVLALCSCLAPVGDDPTGDAPAPVESYADLSACGRACLTCEIASCTSVQLACQTSRGEGRDTVEADGVELVCTAAVEAGCGDRHSDVTLERCEQMCAESAGD